MVVITFIDSPYCLRIFHNAGLCLLSNVLRKSMKFTIKGRWPSVQYLSHGRCMIFHAWTRIAVVGATDLYGILHALACGSAARPLWQTPCLPLTVMLSTPVAAFSCPLSLAGDDVSIFQSAGMCKAAKTVCALQTTQLDFRGSREGGRRVGI